jgi:phage shock protein PspC (stress-responsive transcriptional regulator)
MADSSPNPLTRSKSERMLLGVCGGVAKWLGWDPTIVRVVYVLVSVCSAGFPGIFVYLILAIVMPPGD